MPFPPTCARLALLPCSALSRLLAHGLRPAALPRRCHSTAPAPPPTSIDPAEVSKFSALAQQWWADPTNGPFAGLHRLNAVRVPLIRRAVANDFLPRRAAAAAAGQAEAPSASLPLAGLAILDAGCGGGILSEALARLGASVTGLDASPAGAAAATAHAALDPAVARRTRYLAGTVEALAASGAAFDACVCSEVLEHVAEPEAFVGHLAALTRPGGHLVLTTINRTLPALWGAVLAAEYVLRLVPPGTHEWGRFVQPSELQRALQGAGCQVEQCTGMAYNPLWGTWSLTPSTAINYACVARKPL
jgi:2-polyprenyl-6-hydroxyphenyl methylase/3-demethylubiquinone-9 3-methyltransferase